MGRTCRVCETCIACGAPEGWPSKTNGVRRSGITSTMLDCICLAQSALLGCGFGFGTGCACWVLFAAALCTATLPKLLLLSAGVSCRACGVSIAVFINAQQVRVPQTHGCGLCRGGCYLRCYGDHGVSVSHTRQMSPHTYLVARQHWIRSDHICLLFRAVHAACTITADDACQ